MLKFYSIPDPDKLLSIVDKSEGDVFLRLPDGGECNLKQEHLARELLRLMSPSDGGISIELTNPSDTPAFLSYMMGCQPVR